MTEITLIPGDNRISLRRLIDEGVRVHAVVTDPPYGLVSVQKRFGKEGSAAARTDGNDGSFARLSGGFMGKVWDGTGIERDPEFWKLIYDILLPGGFVFAFSGSRTGHWQACAMETAGFIMHPMHGWVFGSGFPKAHAADKAIDKMAGALEHRSKGFNAAGLGAGYESNGGSQFRSDHPDYIPYEARTPEAARWKGWAYGTQAQKPALEPIYLGQKPFSEKTGAANLLKHGVGAVNIDGCRVPTTENLNGGAYAKNPTPREQLWGEDAGNGYRRGGAGEFIQPEGRHPANLILDGSPEVVAMFPNGKSGKPGVRRKDHDTHSMSGRLGNTGEVEVGYADEGSAARFFHQFPRRICDTCDDLGWVPEGDYAPEMYPVACPTCTGATCDADPLFYHPKAGKVDRDGSKHPTVKPIALMQYLIRHITPPGGVVLDPFAGSGTTGEAARREGFDCILMEAEPEYIDFLESRFSLAQDQEPASSQDVYLEMLGLVLPDS